MKSSFKFIQKLWTLNQKILNEINADHSKNSKNEIEITAAKFIDNVQKNIENFSYNKIIANFYEMYASMNKILNNKIDKEKLIKNYGNILIAMSPVLPHFTNECLEGLKIMGFKNTNKWPKIQKNILISDKINFVIQINGKTRGILNLNMGLSEKEILNKINEDTKLNNYIKNLSIQKTIFIPNKLINILI